MHSRRPALSLSVTGCNYFRCEKVLVHERISDTSVRRLRQQKEAFWKQLHLHHEKLRGNRLKERQALLGTGNNQVFVEAFSFALGRTNIASSFHF